MKRPAIKEKSPRILLTTLFALTSFSLASQDVEAQEVTTDPVDSTGKVTSSNPETSDSGTSAGEVQPGTEAETPASTETDQPAPSAKEPSPNQPATNTQLITIAHTNDMHGRLEAEGSADKQKVTGMAQASAYFDQIQADAVFDAGDAFQGLPLSNHDKGHTMAQAMKEAGYDAIAVGNHEFDFGEEIARSYEDILGFPVLSANVEKDGQPVFNPSVNVHTNNFNLGVVGVTTPETAYKTHPKNVEGMTFAPPIESTIKELNRLLDDESVQEDAYVVLAHLGIDPATRPEWRGDRLAEALDALERFDPYQIILIDGHSHTAVPGGKTYGNVYYAQTGTALNNIGVIQFDPTKPGSAKGRLVSAEEVRQSLDGKTDPQIEALIDQARADYDNETSRELVASNPVFLNGRCNYVRSHETNLGNLITDAMVAYGREGGFNNPTDFAMINGGGIREEIAKDEPITEGDVIAVLPFGNIQSQIEVTGQQIYDMFNLAYSAPTTEGFGSEAEGNRVDPIDEDSGLPALNALGGFLQVSSDIKVYFDPTAEDRHKRVLGVYLRDPQTGDYALIPKDTSQTYYMATNDFLAQGGDGYDMLSGAREEGPSLDQVVMAHIEKGGQELLKQYADPLPQDRIIPITQADYATLTKTDDSGRQIHSLDNEAFKVEEVGRYESGAPFDEGGTEIVVYNPSQETIYSINGHEKAIDIIDASQAGNMPLQRRILLKDLGLTASDLTSIALHPSGQIFAVAAPALEKTDPGNVAFFTADGNYINHVQVGALPDNLQFTHKGDLVLVTNEGEPNDDYTVNPAGGLSVIEIPADFSTISQDQVTTIELTEADMPEALRQLGPDASHFARNMEPEYLVIDKEDQYAYVSLQEVNAIAKFNIPERKFDLVKSLGYKDHSLEADYMDPSDRDDKHESRKVPVLALHQPDAIALFEVDGESYLILPNEGDSQDYSGYSEEVRVKDLAKAGLIDLDASYYQGYTQEELDQAVAQGLFDDGQLGRLRVTTAHPFKTGDTHNALVAFGGRSFSIVRASDLELIYDSGNDFERLIQAINPDLFNSEIEVEKGQRLPNPDSRSDNKGSEPETAVVGYLNGKPYAFIALERSGGIMVYDVSDPYQPNFVDYIYDPSFQDVSPEGLYFIPADQSQDGHAHLLAAYEVSGTIADYRLKTPKVTTEPNQPGSEKPGTGVSTDPSTKPGQTSTSTPTSTGQTPSSGQNTGLENTPEEGRTGQSDQAPATQASSGSQAEQGSAGNQTGKDQNIRPAGQKAVQVTVDPATSSQKDQKTASKAKADPGHQEGLPQLSSQSASLGLGLALAGIGFLFTIAKTPSRSKK
ncbi:choice-of-anchor I family protein [Aerococcus sanguinicola]|uniref:choice-of-anchor I family protein n=1 Tax=Aerococcus sanguinicola TaxID=119206 RepID=UPI0018A73416|nr:choice-of-anchor I family protein [Aerococcus sanguinicola]